MIIKKAQEHSKEFQFIADTRARVGPSPFMYHSQEALLNIDQLFLKAGGSIDRNIILTDENSYAGYFEFKQNNNRATLNMYILPEFRNKGIGSSIINKIEATLSNGSTLTVWSDNNDSNKSFYFKKGFSLVEQNFDSRIIPNKVSKELLENLNKKSEIIEAQGIFAKKLKDSNDAQKIILDLYEKIHYDVQRTTPIPFNKNEAINKFEMSSKELSFIACKNEKPVGFVLYMPVTTHSYHVFFAGVLAEFRRKGISTYLRFQVIKTAQELEVSQLTGTHSINNKKIESFLASMEYDFSNTINVMRKVINYDKR